MSWALWITGPPGSGKSVRARATAERLADEGVAVQVLELDEMRKVVTPRPTYSDTERTLVYHALVWVAKSMVDAGFPVIIDATAHRREWRDLARLAIPAFAEVQLFCPLPVCREREAGRTSGHAPPGIYARAGEPGARVPGVDVEYEEALAPEMTIDSATEGIERTAARIAGLAHTLGPAAAARDVSGPQWALWITGLPGSGKTTLAQRVAERLEARGIGIRILDLAEARTFVGHAGDRTGLAEEIVHRTLVYAARRLTRAGVPVIVDATAPRREWRELARELIRHFAEVQLLCPAEVCSTRERAARWRLGGCTYSQPTPLPVVPPDVVIDYEPSLRPELIIHTDVQDEWSACDALVQLARRLHQTCLEATEAEWDRA